ncbi:hypothetical protein [Paenibacillus odorifer]|uniref:hypothetical protein n=1 Tax=Paenibacillus odorifer TaxID=189426 RepID=UPI002DBE4605|nr:hypothetical protein [Paenibacillus odorifer]MEC0131492.1 hypothetical protein [Paenibacillus odorifer]MEC0220355.1 hypothetical protein [Paenibacillus odorifer]
MDRKKLVAEAVEAGRIASHNLKVIQGNPEAVKHGQYDSIENYLMMVIRVAEIEKARLAGRTSLRTRLKYLVASILREDLNKGKRDAA